MNGEIKMSKKKKLTLDDFLSTAPKEYREFVVKTDEIMVKLGFKQFIDEKRSGLMAKYLYPKNKTTIPFKFFYQKDGTLGMHLTANFFHLFDGLLENLPLFILSQIDTSHLMKACIKCPNNCTAKQNDFEINGVKKEFCFGGVSIGVDSESMKISDMLESKLRT